MKTLNLYEIHRQMADVAAEDQAPVVVDRLQFLDWVVSLHAIIGDIDRVVANMPKRVTDLLADRALDDELAPLLRRAGE